MKLNPRRKRNSILLFLLMSVMAFGKGVTSIKAADKVVILDNIGVNVPTTTNSTIATTVVNNYTLNYLHGKKQSNSSNHAIFLEKDKGAFISNKTPIPGTIKSVKVFILTGASGSTTYYTHFKTTEFLAPGTGGTAVNITAGNSYTYLNTTQDATFFAVSLGNNYNGQILKLEITYEDIYSIPVSGVSLSPKELNLIAGGETSTLTATVLPNEATNKKVIWTSSDETVATVSNTGVVTPIKYGIATITGTTEDGNQTDTATVNVNYAPLESISLNKEALNISLGGIGQLISIPNPIGGNGEVSWSSSNEGIATVSNSGVVQGIKVGTAIITATSVLNPSLKASANITVVLQAQYEKVTSAEQLYIGATYVIAATSSSKTYVMTTTQNTNNRSAKEISLSEGKIIEDVDIQELELVIGTKANSYGFKAINGTTKDKYLAAASNNNNHLHSDESLTDNGSWTINISSKEVKAQGSYTRNMLRFNSTNNPPLFSAYASGQGGIDLYVDENSIPLDNSYAEAYSFAEEVINGIGLGAVGQCEAAYDLLNDEYINLSSLAKEVFNTNREEIFILARERMEYLHNYVNRLPLHEGIQRPLMIKDNLLIFTLLSLFGSLSFGGYLFFKKKSI